jgi:hypothetical protein
MEAVGTAPSRDVCRRLAHTARDADSASCALDSIFPPDFAFRLGRPRIPGDALNGAKLCPTRPRNLHSPVLRLPTGGRGVPPKRYEELRMSILSEQNHLNPHDPSYYAPRWLRERSDSSLSASRQTRPEPVGGPILHPASPASLDIELENAVSDALWRPLDPEIIYESPEFAAERDRRTALTSVAGRFAAAVGVSAIVALFFVIMIPASRDHALQPDGSGSSFSWMMQSIKAAFHSNSKPAVSEFQTVLASTPTSQAVMTHEQPEALLQQFLQWRQKTEAHQ